jgi:hypothetical protein
MISERQVEIAEKTFWDKLEIDPEMPAREAFRAALEAAEREAGPIRDAALEEAAKVADECSYSGTGLWIAEHIRALKSPPAIHDKTEG